MADATRRLRLPASPGAVLAAVAAATLAATMLLAGPAGAAADDDQVGAHRGPRFGATTTSDSELQVSTPTFDKSQAKTWWHDGRWWGLLYEPSDASVRIGELGRNHRWTLGDTVVARRTIAVGDAVVDDDEVHVLVRRRGGLAVTTLAYTRKGGYRVEAPLRQLGTRGSNAATMTLDTTGRLWVSFIKAARVTVMHSNPSRTSWGLPYVPAVPAVDVGRGELTDVAAADGAVLVIWSDQRRGAFHAARHVDGAPDSSWTGESAAKGDHIADDHVSAFVLPGKGGDTVLVAVKTSRNDYRDPARDDPLILLLVRTPAGVWSQHVVATVGDGWTRPVVSASASGRVFVIGRRAGSIVYKPAPLDDLTFESGPGRHLLTFTGASFTDPSVGTQTPDAVTGLLVLASDERELHYWHAELGLSGTARGASAGDRPDRTPPAAPEDVNGIVLEGNVRLSWSAPTDVVGWAPAGVPPGVTYEVFRGGTRVGRTGSTSYVVDSGAGALTVVAVDLAGNRSAEVRAEVATPRSDSSTAGLALVLLVGGALAVVCVVVGVYVHLRRHLRRTAQQAQRLLIDAPVKALVPAPRGKHARR